MPGTIRFRTRVLTPHHAAICPTRSTCVRAFCMWVLIGLGFGNLNSIQAVSITSCTRMSAPWASVCRFPWASLSSLQRSDRPAVRVSREGRRTVGGIEPICEGRVHLAVVNEGGIHADAVLVRPPPTGYTWSGASPGRCCLKCNGDIGNIKMHHNACQQFSTIKKGLTYVSP